MSEYWLERLQNIVRNTMLSYSCTVNTSIRISDENEWLNKLWMIFQCSHLLPAPNRIPTASQRSIDHRQSLQIASQFCFMLATKGTGAQCSFYLRAHWTFALLVTANTSISFLKHRLQKHLSCPQQMHFKSEICTNHCSKHVQRRDLISVLQRLQFLSTGLSWENITCTDCMTLHNSTILMGSVNLITCPPQQKKLQAQVYL